ncbi:hypothetical protein B0J12DRAFT_704525 [Macrophomina phaseolina]|uniref:Uncharacterized protein n=1 Tax=Macrophomina phaseolina TaxID=35725 RepID=A0ABQ8FUZ7_9PEZI|nr:hypothetical protein B0J12DRAFT_704525 [Macrophomina phaseolina]
MPRVIADDNVISKRSSLEIRVKHILNSGSSSDERALRPFAEPGPPSAQGHASHGVPRSARSRHRNDLTSSLDAHRKPTPALCPKNGADERETYQRKDFSAWVRTSNSGIESRWRFEERTTDRIRGTLPIGALCNMEHSREQSRMKRDEERHMRKRSEKAREGWAKRDKRMEAILQRLDSQLEQNPGMTRLGP